MMEFGIVFGVLIVLKLFFWVCYFSFRRRRAEQTAEALRQQRAAQMTEAQRQQRAAQTAEALKQLRAALLAEALRKVRALQMAEAGLIHPAPTPGSTYPPIVTRGQTPGVHAAQPNNNTTTLTPNAIGGTQSVEAPPSYQEAVGSPSLPQEAPPAFTEESS